MMIIIQSNVWNNVAGVDNMVRKYIQFNESESLYVYSLTSVIWQTFVLKI